MSGFNPYAVGASAYNNGAGMQQMQSSANRNGMMMGAPEDGMNSVGGQSLDDIVNQNVQLVRSQSMSQHYSSHSNQQTPIDADMRRMSSMMEFTGASSSGPLEHYQFGGSASMNQTDPMATGLPIAHSDSRLQRQPSSNNLSLNPGFVNPTQNYPPILSHASSFQSNASQSNHGADMGLNSPYVSTSLGMAMDYSNSPDMSAVVAMDQTPVAMYTQSPFHPSMLSSPMHANVSNAMHSLPLDSGGGRLDRQNSSYEPSQTRSSSDSINTARPHQSQSASSHTPQNSKSPHPRRGSQQTQQQLEQQYQNKQQRHQQQGKQQDQQDQNQQQQHQQQQQQQQQQQHPHQSQSQSQSQSHQQQQQQQNQHQSEPQSHPQQQQQQRHSGSASQQNQDSSGFSAQPQHPQPGSANDVGMQRSRELPDVDPKTYNPNNQGFDWKPQDGEWPSTLSGRPHMQSAYKNAYSSTGFDMLGVLMRVATRPNPEINIGSVDLSCAFVVCDAEKDDFPIVYCSDNFERLTGYTRHMILGRNCRFLQSPDGNVESGVKRKYVDDDSVLYLKNMINLRREAQISLINYRRGGQPFMNLLTMIPISWNSDQVKFFVGFQVDLVEQPNAVTNRNPDGTFSINYQRGMAMPRYVVNAPESNPNRAELCQTIPRDDVSAILSTIGTGESDYAKRMWDKVLLENTDDVVHVLSLKGLFQWVSPSSVRVLEYEPSELIGTALSSVCHPSDIVPVTRELKDTSTGSSVNIVFRIRRKHSGYVWFEGHGSLHTEQGKGRKSIILVGRERPVYTLSKRDVTANDGIGENELWTKMSTSGMFLFVSSNVRQLLDRQPDELVGVSIQSLMRSESKTDFVRILEHARTGKKASVKHEMINRRGQVLQAFTTLYPGDAVEGQKPTFIVAQTKLIKHARANITGRPNVFSKMDRGSSESINSAVAGQRHRSIAGDETPVSSATQMSVSRYVATDGAAATYGGNNGLLLGRQDASLASEDNLFDELRTTKSSSWQYEIRQLEKKNRLLAEEVQSLLAAKKKRKRRKGAGQLQKDCANCHTRVTPEWRRGPSGQRDLCNSCGLRWAKLNGRVSPRANSHSARSVSDRGSQASVSPRHVGDPTNVNTSIKAEPPTPAHYGMKSSPLTAANNLDTYASQQFHDGHASNMQGAAGVPDRTTEEIEDDDDDDDDRDMDDDDLD